MKKLIITFFLATLFIKAFSQKTQTITGDVKCIIQNKLITSEWTDEDDASTASLFQTDLKTKSRHLIAKDLGNDQIAAIDEKILLYINDKRLFTFDITNRQNKVIYKVNDSVDIVGISLDLAKENIYAIEIDRKLKIFKIVCINIFNRTAKIVAISKFDLEDVEYVNAKIVTKKNNLYIWIDFMLYEFDIIKNQLSMIDSAITSFAIDNDSLYYFKNYKESKPQLEVINLLNSKRLIIDKVDKYKIVESIYSCKNRELKTSIINNKYRASLNYCGDFFRITDSSFKPIDKFVLFENEKVIVFKNKDNFNKDKTNYILKK
ncbi:hypothetical protein [Arcicella rosea]|uniref:Uncharacterized protein n=1 Tax=Arcicella rosea TaxID=502909 RepID=A0A841EZC5_9BACT|nr:hypothetical protein [Arcicella rosea]MBB6005700.1 hypothetical protein [Arcicella rosea]